MNVSIAIKVLLAFGPVLMLVGLGLAISLRSGVVHVASGQGLRRIFGNLSQTVLLLSACLLLLVAIQEVVGYKVHLGW